MRGGAKFFAGAALLGLAACGGSAGKLEIRSIPGPSTATANTRSPLSDAYAQLSLGNVGLALELFRKGGRQNPSSSEAYAGMARCYDLMGRFDLSRRNYETALAIHPHDSAVLAMLASSLESQGLADEAASIRREIAEALAEAQTADMAMDERGSIEATNTSTDPSSSGPSASISAAPRLIALSGAPAAGGVERVDHWPGKDPLPATRSEQREQPAGIGKSVTVALPSAQPGPENRAVGPIGKSVTIALPPPRPYKPEPSPAAPRQGGLRLVRLSMGEVALVTTGEVPWRPMQVAGVQVRQPRFVRLESPTSLGPVRLLNAARIEGLAARTRGVLRERGWNIVAIGNAPRVRATSIIIYPRSQQLLAQRAAVQFGFPAVMRPTAQQVTIFLGGDAPSRLRRRG